MQAECDALPKNHLDLVAPPSNTAIIQCKRIFRVKYHADGTLDKYKTRLVAKGFQQVPGINFFDTFSLVVKSTTIRIIFFSWLLHEDGTFNKWIPIMPSSMANFMRLF